MAEKKVVPKKLKLKKPVVRRSTKPESQRPLFSMGTLITLVVFGAVVLFMVYLNRQKEVEPVVTEPAAEEIGFIFENAGESLVSRIEVKPADGETIRLARNAENIWAFELPEKTEADQGQVEAAASQVFALLADKKIEGKLSVFGLEKPAYIITLTIDGKQRALEVGDATPLNDGYYVRVDKQQLMITPLSGIDALIQLSTFPPYVATPIPPEDAEAETTATPTP